MTSSLPEQPPLDPEYAHEYNQALQEMYLRTDPSVANIPPPVSDPEVAHSLANDLVQRLSDAKFDYDDTMKAADEADNTENAVNLIGLAQQNRREGVFSAASIIEMKHRKQLPGDFADGQKHYRSMVIDEGMRNRMRRHNQARENRAIEALESQFRDPKTSGLLRLVDPDKPKDQ